MTTHTRQAVPQTLPLPCFNCEAPFYPKRSTGKFCGPTCRVQWHRKQKRTPGTPQNVAAEVKADIEVVYQAVHGFINKYKLSDMGGSDYGPLEEALEDLGAFFDCEQCGERKADGWENLELCRRCEIETFELVCWQCEKRKPSVKSDDMLCATCEKQG